MKQMQHPYAGENEIRGEYIGRGGVGEGEEGTKEGIKNTYCS